VRSGSRRSPVLVAAVLILLLAGCTSDEPTAATDARAPHLVMTGPQSGFAVWPSGVRWIVLGTTDGWRTVSNRTPLAVPTDGGLVLSADPTTVAVGVLPHEQLSVSPVLQSTTAGGTWVPTQLPGALSSSATALARSGGATWAVLAGGSVVTEVDGTTGWREAASAAALDPTGHLTLTGVDFPDTTTGFVTGSGPGDRPILFVTTGQTSFAAVQLGLGGTGEATALAPCHIGSTWMAPVVTGGRLVVFTAPDLAGTWTAGPALEVSGTPVVACGPDRVWAVAPKGSVDELSVAFPGGPWTLQGQLGAGTTSLSVVSADRAYVSAAAPATLTAVYLGASLTSEAVPLPGWVETVGGAPMRN